MLAFLISFAFMARGDNYEEMEKLKEEKRQIALEMHKKRVELIQNNPSLKELQKKIIALHKELAIRIDNNSEMRELVNKQKEIETKIKVLENK